MWTAAVIISFIALQCRSVRVGEMTAYQAFHGGLPVVLGILAGAGIQYAPWID